MPHPLFFRIQKPEEGLHLCGLLPAEMSIRNEDPVFFSPRRNQVSPSQATVTKTQPPHLVWIVDISQIDEIRAFQKALNPL